MKGAGGTKKGYNMTINKLVSGIFKGGDRPDVVEQGAGAERKARKDTKMLDLAHEALANRAASDSRDLNGLVNMGWPHVQREKFKGKVRKKVWDIVKDGTGGEDKEMIEEITDRIVEASEADEFYKRIFDKDEA